MSTKQKKPSEELTYVTVNGEKRLQRNCWDTKKHDAHTWKSYVISAEGAPAWCDGTGVPPTYYPPTAYSRVKKDYSEDTDFLVSDPITVSQARAIAFDMHREQKDKSGRPYTEHLHAVEMGVRVLGGSTEERIAALFHDAVEDHHTTYDLLRKINVTEHTIEMIEAVSKRAHEEQTKYLERVCECGPGAMRVKLSDLLHNTRHDRIQALRDDKKEHVADRLLKKYRPAMARLMLELGMIITEDEQKKIATKPQGTATGSYGYTTSKPTQSAQKPATSSTTPHPSTWEAHSVLPGDWPVNWSAPVLEVRKEAAGYVFTLASGEVRTVSEKSVLTLFTYEAWSNDARIVFGDVSEETVLGFCDLLKDVDAQYAWDPDTLV